MSPTSYQAAPPRDREPHLIEGRGRGQAARTTATEAASRLLRRPRRVCFVAVFRAGFEWSPHIRRDGRRLDPSGTPLAGAATARAAGGEVPWRAGSGSSAWARSAP